MSWLSDIIRNEVVRAFEDPAIQEQARQAVLRVLDDEEVLDKLHALIDARIKAVLCSPDPIPLPEVPPKPLDDAQIGGPLILFDLPQVAVDLNNLGFPGYEGEILYCLACIVRGDDIPNDPDHAGVQAFYQNIRLQDELSKWYVKKISDAKNALTADKSLTLKIIENDQRDRFGCRIGPRTFERFAEFGNRVTLGQIVPESEY